MAFFIIQPKGESGKWCKPDCIKLNLTVSDDKLRLKQLRAESENVFKISFQDMKDKEFRIVDGQLVSAYSKSPLKVQILDLAVEKRWTHEETMRALYRSSPSQRKELLETASEE